MNSVREDLVFKGLVLVIQVSVLFGGSRVKKKKALCGPKYSDRRKILKFNWQNFRPGNVITTCSFDGPVGFICGLIQNYTSSVSPRADLTR